MVRRSERPAAQARAVHGGHHGVARLAGRHLGEADLTVLGGGPHAVDDTAVEVCMGIERSAETMDEAHCRQPSVVAATAFAPPRFDSHDPQKNVQHGTERRRITLRT